MNATVKWVKSIFFFRSNRPVKSDTAVPLLHTEKFTILVLNGRRLLLFHESIVAFGRVPKED